MTEEDRSVMQKILDAIPGERSKTSCGCEWARIPEGIAVEFAGVRITGDVLVKQCEYHAWYSAQPLSVQRQVEQQRRIGRTQ